ncbi:helix-turn-helix domain-containing protein [Paenibacillus sp. LHD-117]|uniref:GH39 family glycosyl hydrolase n=1 Tax=Paenibacillus sp. LHD-117 TaxID=3071412 RepID=UPI0027DF2D66|nr:helix-turn-helix domain-containing protein [Paenibacillus sp. LHD-117]MDQ6420027.1 helix-turn-helix domain-containing protein [Paenibacillus sp. LHD-117]
MRYYYEFIEHQDDLPIRLFVNSVAHIPFHWHKEIEIIYVLQGSVSVHVDQRQYELGQDGIIVLNSMSVHQIERTHQDNVLLTLQFGSELLGDNVVIDCISIGQSDHNREAFDLVRRELARMAWEASKKAPGYRSFSMGSLQTLAGQLLRYFPGGYNDQAHSDAMTYDYKRLNRVLRYVDMNYSQKITLQTIADQEHLSLHYFSHFFSDKIGIPFQKYLTSIRLEKAASALADSGKNMTQIALDCGFANVKLFNKYFKEKFGCTPSAYREASTKPKEADPRRLPFTYDESSSGNYYVMDTIQAMESLYRYLRPDESSGDVRGDEIPGDMHHTVILSMDASNPGTAFTPHWNRVTTAGRAAEGLRSDWREQLTELQRKLGFRFIRFHGIFNDEMMVYREDDQGNPLYNWTYVDNLYDFLLGEGIRPFVELGFMPTALRRSNETIFWWKANISPPSDQAKWNALVRAFVAHCANRYGMEEVRGWRFEVWNEPDLAGVCWAGTKEEYFTFYEETARAIKSVDERLKVGGPALGYGSLWNDDWAEQFMSYCRHRAVPLDFFSFHVYSEYPHSKEETDKLSTIMPPSFFRDSVLRLRSIIGKDENPGLELNMTEWNFSLYDRNLLHDTMFMAPFVIFHALETSGMVDAIAFWSFTDVFEESFVPSSPFYGGFGLINRNGLKKPGYYAFELLGKLGNRILAQGEGYIATRSEDGGIQLLLYHYVHVDKLFASGDWTGLSELSRYSVFEEKGPRAFRISLGGMDRSYRMTSYRLDRDHGSVFDEWVRMGAPEHPSEAELDYLRGRSGPEIRVERVDAQGTYELSCILQPHGIALFTFDPYYG